MVFIQKVKARRGKTRKNTELPAAAHQVLAVVLSVVLVVVIAVPVN